MMMCLGDFVFKLSTLAFQDLQRQTQWKHEATARVGARPAYQFTGEGSDTISMSGVVVPGFGNKKELATVREMADAGLGYMLVDGRGFVYGQFAVTSLSENKSYFDKFGQPLKTEFTIALERVDDRLEELGSDADEAEEEGQEDVPAEDEEEA